MSLHENTPEGERTAELFHLVCAAVGALHLLIGAGMLAWHLAGARDHRENRELLEARKR
jgi:hypothetical protein